jgi:archaellin
MPSADSFPLPIIGAAILGSLLIVAGLYVQRRGKLRTRQGAAILASFVAVLGIVVVVCAVIAIMFARTK